MSVNVEYCDPFSGDGQNIWMKLEHCGRYMYARDFLAEKGCKSVIDLAASNGYGSMILSERVSKIVAADCNAQYLDSEYLSQKTGISTLCFDFDEEDYPKELSPAEAVVCFETIEHLRYPHVFLKKIAGFIMPSGWLLLSFPNAEFEIMNADGTNRDPFHRHVLDYALILSELKNIGFHIYKVLGQPITNDLCSRQHELKLQNVLKSEDVDRAFHYDDCSIRTLARLIAWPQEENIKNSYSFFVIAQRQYPLEK